MSQLFCREVVLENKTDHDIQLKESRHHAADYSYAIQLNPADRMKIRARMFHRRAKQAGRASTIRVFCDGVERVNKALTPQVFIDFFSISFMLDRDGELTVRGVRARGIEQIRRIRGLGFLIGFGNNYSQGEEEVIV